MTKKLDEMSLEEMWQLFPIYLTEHKREWKSWYEDERVLLRERLPESQIKRISHAGSTAIETTGQNPSWILLLRQKKILTGRISAVY